MKREALLTLSVLLASCGRDPNQASFEQNVAQVFAPCNDAEIRYLAGKHNFQTAFEPCGSNNFHRFSWSPDGTHLYFGFTMSHHIMDVGAPDKRVITVPASLPAGEVAWLNAQQIAIPVPPPHGQEADPYKISVFDQEALTVFDRVIPEVRELDHLTVGDSAREVLFSGVKDGVRSVYRVQLDQGEVSPAWPWLQGPIDNFTYTPQQGAVAVGRGETVTLYQAPGGEELGVWTGVTRGELAPEGRWLALEFDGPPVSVFFQRHWDELSEKARERELRRAKEYEKTLPKGTLTEVRPPSISLVDLESRQQWYFDSFQGDQFQWYQGAPSFFSVRLWGFEDKQLKPNVVLGSFGDRIVSMERGELPMGVHRWEELSK
ncbi:MAG: hypothetical protein JXX28_13085 [Deltaproteobacteria bacterium]|nr:hypothetical protein [Deltaproteobacteria bacterium]